MSNHEPQIIEVALNHYQATCNCRSGSKIVKHKWEAEDWIVKHVALVEQARAHLGPKSVSLARQRDYYREQQDNEDLPLAERIVWRQLADELSHRLNDASATDDTQAQLW